jgi:hypothetical protein
MGSGGGFVGIFDVAKKLRGAGDPLMRSGVAVPLYFEGER